jgi:hypothetical protein
MKYVMRKQNRTNDVSMREVEGVDNVKEGK